MNQKITITDEVAGQRLDSALSAVTGLSRSQIQKALKENRISSDSTEAVSAKDQARSGRHYFLEAPEIESAPPAPDLKVIYEDKQVLVIDKPAGIAVHLGESQRQQPTVAAFGLKKGVKDNDDERPGLVHRLDKDTSGVMIIAKDPETKAFLQKQFKQRQVEKSYLALIKGRLKEHRAVIKLPIGRSRKDPLKRAVLPGGRESATAYEVIEELPKYSLLRVNLLTGRTHQIRVHFAHIGHAVVGDSFYGSAEKSLNRQFLHAESLKLELPTGVVKNFKSQLPAELKAFLVEAEKRL